MNCCLYKIMLTKPNKHIRVIIDQRHIIERIKIKTFNTYFVSSIEGSSVGNKVKYLRHWVVEIRHWMGWVCMFCPLDIIHENSEWHRCDNGVTMRHHAVKFVSGNEYSLNFFCTYWASQILFVIPESATFNRDNSSSILVTIRWEKSVNHRFLIVLEI